MAIQSLVYGALTVVAGLAAAAGAQDSVSRNFLGGNGLPGDGLGPWNVATQRMNYVVDLSPIVTSRGTLLGLAPIAKSGRIVPTKFSAYNGSSAVSQRVRTSAAYPSAAYSLWTQAGGGINATDNNTALVSTLNPTGAASVFGFAFLDFEETVSGPTLIFTNQVTGGLIAFDPAVPDRLYVTRVVAAQNNTNSTQSDTSQFGLGAVDSVGNVVARGDGFTSTATGNVLTGDNLIRVRMQNRTNSSLNVISNLGGSEAGTTDFVLAGGTTTLSTPACLGADVAGRNVVVAGDFLGRLASETGLNAITTATAHRPQATDHRGSPHVSGRAVFAGTVGTGVMVSRSVAGGGSKNDALSVFGLDASGSAVTARTLVLPGVLLDTCDAFSWPLAGGEFRNYDSQVTFRGGTGTGVVGQDAVGRAVAAATLYAGSAPNPANGTNAVAAVRFDPTVPNSSATWTIAAWVDGAAMTGKALTGDFGSDGAPNTGDAGEGDGVLTNDSAIGRLASLTETSLGFSGPSMSAPTMDAAGNLYFISAIRTNRLSGASIVQDTGVGLVRAVYDSATFCYRLEVVAKVGDVMAGRNSARNYRIATLNVADTDSVSTASVWGSSGSQTAWNNSDVSSLSAEDSRNVGGVVLSARIAYDVNTDGLYEDPTAVGGNAASIDEAYNVVLLVANTTPLAPPGCPADWDGDDDVDSDDIGAFFGDWEQGEADFDNDGDTDSDDIGAFFGSWEGGC